MDSPVRILAGSVTLDGHLTVSERATGIVLFAHGSGSSRLSPRNRFVAHQLQEAGLGTLLFDLLSPAEEKVDEQTREYRRVPDRVQAVVSRGGRPDLAAPLLGSVGAPTLLIVGGRDDVVIGMNEDALAQLKSEKTIEIVPGATHLFSEEGALERVAELAAEWFAKHLA